jgi:hypothetical protein
MGFREMRAMRTCREIGIVCDQEKKPPLLCELRKRPCQRTPAAALPRSEHDETSFRQTHRRAARVGQAFVIGHQHERRQRPLIEPERKPC